MNCKERVLCTIAHKEPDRVPVGEWGIDHDHASRVLGRHTYWRNRKDETLALWEGRRDELVESQKVDYAELVEKLDYDIVTVGFAPSKKDIWQGPPPRKTGDGIWEDNNGNVYKYAASNDSIQSMGSGNPSAHKESLTPGEIREYAERILTIDESVFELVDYFGDRFGDERAVLFRGLNIYGILLSPFGGDFMEQMIVLNEAEDILISLKEAAVKYNKLIIDHCAAHKVSIMMQGHDFCMNIGPMFSPDTMRRVFFPLMKEVNDEIHRQGMPSFFHCCGNTASILDDFVSAGYQGYQSIQVSAGLNNKEIKEKYGNHLTLWTGVQCETLVGGSREDAEREVRGNLKDLMPGGGFIFGSTNSVQYGAKTDNYLRALDIVRKEGVYG